MENSKNETKIINPSGSCQNFCPIEYNYPSLKKKDCMYLSTLNNFDFPLKKFKQLNTNRNWSINLYNLDIEGSSPRRFGAFNQKTDYTNTNSDIEKSSPKQLHIKLKKPEYNLSNEDIEFSRPHCVKINCNRHLNPLEPKYQFSKCEEYAPYQPKFIRDGISVSDIEGAKPKKIVSQTVLRESLKKDDIKDSWPRRPYVRKSKYEFMDYRDVTNTDFQSRRNTNPLMPLYNLNYCDNSKVSIGPISGNAPCVFSTYKIENPYNLRLDDIDGTNVGSRNFINKFKGNNFCYSSSDIQGAQSGTLKKGIVTKRKTNPVWPKYQFLGADELKGVYENNPYNNINKKVIEKKGENSNEKNNEKLLDKNLKITKNEKNDKTSNENLNKSNKQEEYKIFIRPDGKPDFGNLPYIEDNIDFEKNKYKKPDVFFGVPHDKYLIPPIENFKKCEIRVNPELRSFQEINKKRVDLLSHPKITPLGSEPHKTYATKLDDFMAVSNLKFIDAPKQKVITSYVKTGLPENINESDTTNNKTTNIAEEVK